MPFPEELLSIIGRFRKELLRGHNVIRNRSGLVSIAGMVGNPSPSGEAEGLSVTHSELERMERSASSGYAQNPSV
jgi:hypothetical protein